MRESAELRRQEDAQAEADTRARDRTSLEDRVTQIDARLHRLEVQFSHLESWLRTATADLAVAVHTLSNQITSAQAMQKAHEAVTTAEQMVTNAQGMRQHTRQMAEDVQRKRHEAAGDLS